MTRYAHDETSREIYRTTQLRCQLENCLFEVQRLNDRIETLEKEISDLSGELKGAEEELDMYEQMSEFGHYDPEDWEK